MIARIRFASAATLVAALVSLATSPAAQEAPTAAGAVTLFENVRVFDGRGDALSGPTNVLVRGNLIERISPDPIPVDRRADTRVIPGGGRTLMPGLIDAHWHAMLVRPTPAAVIANDIGYTTLQAGAEATATLMRGFTTVRDMGGPSFSLKRAIDEGLLPGPRIYPSGAMISVTGGHGDFRGIGDLPRSPGGPLSRMEALGGAMIADSPDEVRMRVREQLLQGAAHVKLTAGGGVASPFSPLDVSTFTEAELRAAVEAAENWGTYVAAHAYTPAAVRSAVAAGVRVIEHAHLMDEPAAQAMAENGVWLSTQPFVDLGGAALLPPVQQARMRQVVSGTDRVYALAKEYGIPIAFGTDILFSAALAEQQGQMLVDLTRWFTPAEALAMATGTNGELLALTGLRNPYPGRLGVVEEGALADLLLVDGDPLADLSLVASPERSFLVIMKDGQIYKDTLAR